jgi:hypothetical protein
MVIVAHVDRSVKIISLYMASMYDVKTWMQQRMRCMSLVGNSGYYWQAIQHRLSAPVGTECYSKRFEACMSGSIVCVKNPCIDIIKSYYIC